MGMLINGVWSTEWYQPDKEGRFVRPQTVFHGRVTADGSSGHKVEPGRYHLYVSYACPWASRTLLLRKLKGLEAAISVSVVSPLMGDDGWAFGGYPGATEDALFGAKFLREIYVRARPDYTGRVTVPVLWDKRAQTIVNNESREILKMLDLEFATLGDRRSFYPAPLRAEIDAVIEAIYEPINNGVYRAGFAQRQEAYEAAVQELFAALDHWEGVLGRQRYLCGDSLTAADICLFPTLVRFDPVYHGHFKCNLRRLSEYKNLWGYTREIYQLPGVAETVNFDHIKRHYYWSHTTINPTRVVPLGPLLDWTGPPRTL
jgi:glutathionyl-hydroquinone reductase